jgi:hypothetical protein
MWQEKGSFGALIADWPVTDIVGLWTYLKKHGHQLGGLSAPRFLRMVGKDTFVPSYDVVAALNAQKIVDKAPTSLRDLAIGAGAFNQWHEQWRAADEPDFDDAGVHRQSLRPSRYRGKPAMASYQAAEIAFASQLAIQLIPPPHIQQRRAEQRQARAHLQHAETAAGSGHRPPVRP